MTTILQALHALGVLVALLVAFGLGQWIFATKEDYDGMGEHARPVTGRDFQGEGR